MRKIDNYVVCLTGLLTSASLFAQVAASQAPQKAAAAPSAAAAPPTGMPATIGALVQLEAQKALEEARKAANASAPAAPLPVFQPVSRPAVVNTDVVELLGTYRRGDKFAADVAVNGVVSFVQQGDSVGPYEITGIANNCVHLLDMKKVKLLRCHFAGTN